MTLKIGSHLLVHEDKMFILAQSLVHLPPLKRLSQKRLAVLDPQQRLTQLLGALRVFECHKRPGVTDLLDKLHHGGEIVIQPVAERIVQLTDPSIRSATILQRAGSVTAYANGITRLRFGRAMFFQPDFVLLGDVEIIFVRKPTALAQFKGIKHDVGGFGG